MFVVLVSIVHPMAELTWEEQTQLPIPIYEVQCVLIRDMLYVGGGYTPSGVSTKIYVSSTDSINWRAFQTPASQYALATYNSEIVLVGGHEFSTGHITNSLWMSRAGIDWNLSLPPMPTKRCLSSAIHINIDADHTTALQGILLWLVAEPMEVI